ncbi:hypothetical protein ONA00_03710 [Mycoplasmopsis cynos]|uniref:hypothetical protein n=1 Tax=Mycoplasmopsis cynos TaxID=171284 RepID=UPI0024CCFEE3|nr:hypothetical protein [Mycoplasmopsis cynos]WAM10479.1 hypothetical protein ONA00_03710 [Mycoplasmopsis cynos]
MKYISNIMAKNISLKNQAENIWVFQKCEHSKEDLIFQYRRYKVSFSLQKSGSFFKTMQEYMIKFNRLLTSKNVDSINIEKALLKILSSLKKLYISINEDIKIDT